MVCTSKTCQKGNACVNFCPNCAIGLEPGLVLGRELEESHARAAPVLVDELDASCVEGASIYWKVARRGFSKRQLPQLNDSNSSIAKIPVDRKNSCFEKQFSVPLGRIRCS
jgi:ferredoxin